MAKKRKLGQNSTPTSEPQSQPKPEPIEEEQPPTEPETIATAAAEAEEEEEDSEEDVEEEEEGDDEVEEEEPQTVDQNPNPKGDVEDSDPQSIQKILELFPKDQLVYLLRDASVKHADIRREVHRIADVDPAHRKIFVHGLGWDTTVKVLTDVFGQYGEIEDCKAVTDKVTGKSKGYGFILFKHRKGAQNALKEPQKKIGSRLTSCQLASAGPVPAPLPAVAPVSEYTQKKIFISNVGADIDTQKLYEYFSKFGEIEEGPLGLDKATGKPRGFCLFVYKTVESAKKALEEPHKNFEGHMLHCQKAIDGPKNKQGFQFQHASGGQYSIGGNAPKVNFSGGVGTHMPAAGGHLMAPSATGMGYQAPAAQSAVTVGGINPVVNQALTALLLGGLGPAMNQGVPGQMGGSGVQGGYASGQMGYGGQAQGGGYGGVQMGQGRGTGTWAQGGGPSYRGGHH